MKRKLFQRIVAMTLCVVMTVTMFPLSVFAAPKEANITFHMPVKIFRFAYIPLRFGIKYDIIDKKEAHVDGI